ncbi:MAG TPA: AAA family ATPase [Patescibacteria group bacterium]|nr:AAA family ATPase [Patescibacteria group bacterium]
MTTTAILLLSSASEAAEPLAAALLAAGHGVTAVTDADEAIRRAGEFTLVIIDAVNPPRSGTEVCGEIRRTPALSAIPVLCISESGDVEARVRFLEAGADDVLARPLDPREFEARVEALLVRFRRSRDLSPQTGGEARVAARRRLVACFSPKGGVGTTTIAVNVAMALAAQAPHQVAIIDLDIDFGQVATHLNVKPRLTVADLAVDEVGMREPELLRTYAETVDPGLHVVAAPGTPETGRLITAVQVEQILATAALAYGAVIVDAGSTLDERSLAILNWADAVIVPIAPEIGALKALHGFLEYLTEEGAVPAKSTFVLNHLFARDMLSMKQIEGSIAAKVDVELPYDASIYLRSVNEGVPILRGAPASAPGRALARLAALTAGIEATGDGSPDAKRGGILGGLRRRG